MDYKDIYARAQLMIETLRKSSITQLTPPPVLARFRSARTLGTRTYAAPRRAPRA
jgi:hypothetical protein